MSRPVMIGLRSLCFNVLYFVNLTVLMIVGLPSTLMGRHAVFFMARTWASSSLWLLDKVCGLKLEFRGVENIPQGGYIVAAKHQSSLETFALVLKTPDFAIILKKQLLFLPIFGLYLAASGQIAIDRSRGRNALAQIIDKAGAVLRSRRQVYIYPEGTRRPPGAEPQYKPGVAFLYAAADSPCLPVAVNTGMFWGRNGFLRRPGTAVIEFLPVIPPGLPRDVFFERLKNDIETASARLMEEAKAGFRREAGGASRLASAGEQGTGRGAFSPPSPLVWEGRGGGQTPPYPIGDVQAEPTPLPNPPPQGGRESPTLAQAPLDPPRAAP